MSKPLEIIIHDFYGGISDDPRNVKANNFAVSKHFDIFSSPSQITPYRSLEADTNDGSTSTGMKQYSVLDFVYASASSKLYGLGKNASNHTKIVYKGDATTGNWTLPASSEGNGAVWNGCFFEHRDYLWGFQGTRDIFKWGTLSGVPTITNAISSVSSDIVSVANGVVAPGTGEAYMAYNNVVVRISQDGNTVTDDAVSVSDKYRITSLANYGSYLAIGCSPKSSFNGRSVVLIWNLSSDKFVETIDFGEGDLRVLESIEGVLIGITDRYLNNATGAGKGSMIIQAYQGGAAQVLKEVFTQALTGKTIPTTRVVKNNRLFWAAKIMTNSAGTTYDEGIWSFGRKNANYPWSFTIDIVDENVSTSGIQAIGLAANYFFVAHSGDGSIDKTDDATSYAFTSIYESQIFNFDDPTLIKKMSNFMLSVVPIPTGGSITLKYRVDGAVSWTTIGTLNTVGAISRNFVNIESTGADFATFKEVQFRLESTGGVEITGFRIITYPVLGDN